jgi:hypothetical protein
VHKCSATAHTVDDPSGQPVAISFRAQSGHSYEVRAANEVKPAQVIDALTNSPVIFEKDILARAN